VIERQVTQQEQAEGDGNLFPVWFHFYFPVFILMRAYGDAYKELTMVQAAFQAFK
jgi:hypothetical protein